MAVAAALLAGCLTGVVATLAVFKTHNVDVDVADGSGNSKLNAVWSLAQRHYVDPVDNDTVMDRVCAAVMQSLDPHSVYLTSEVLKKESEELSGNFEGVGIVVQMRNDTVCVSQVIPGGPSERVGIQACDRILEVDGLAVSGAKYVLDSVVARLRGPRKSVVDLKVVRPSAHRTMLLKVVRDVITMPSLSYSGMLDARTGYVCIDRFGETTYREFCKAVSDLKGQGMSRLVLDLRGNGGGLLSAALGICDELLPGKELIVYTEGAHHWREEEHSVPGGLFCKGDLVVMIDEFSASASEIVAGAVQDNDRGIIVGRRSFGKGLVQQQYKLPDHSAVQLTVSRYYTPSGRCIQRPYDRGTDEYYSDFIQHVMDEYKGDSILTKIYDTTPYYTSQGRVVYGGGGIYPDHTIHYKYDDNVVYYNQLANKGIISDYVFDYVSQQGSRIKKEYPGAKDFIGRFRVSDDMLEQMLRRADKAGLKRDSRCISRYSDEIRSRIKAEIGSMMYSTSVFYAVQLRYDPELKEALSVK